MPCKTLIRRCRKKKKLSFAREERLSFLYQTLNQKIFSRASQTKTFPHKLKAKTGPYEIVEILSEWVYVVEHLITEKQSLSNLSLQYCFGLQPHINEFWSLCFWTQLMNLLTVFITFWSSTELRHCSEHDALSAQGCSAYLSMYHTLFDCAPYGRGCAQWNLLCGQAVHKPEIWISYHRKPKNLGYHHLTT